MSCTAPHFSPTGPLYSMSVVPTVRRLLQCFQYLSFIDPLPPLKDTRAGVHARSQATGGMPFEAPYEGSGTATTLPNASAASPHASPTRRYGPTRTPDHSAPITQTHSAAVRSWPSDSVPTSISGPTELASCNVRVDLRQPLPYKRIKAFLAALEDTAQALDIQMISRKYRQSFTRNYRSLMPADKRLYRVDVLEAGQESHGALWVNGKKYILGQQVLEDNAKFRRAWTALLRTLQAQAEKIATNMATQKKGDIVPLHYDSPPCFADGPQEPMLSTSAPSGTTGQGTDPLHLPPLSCNWCSPTPRNLIFSQLTPFPPSVPAGHSGTVAIDPGLPQGSTTLPHYDRTSSLSSRSGSCVAINDGPERSLGDRNVGSDLSVPCPYCRQNWLATLGPVLIQFDKCWTDFEKSYITELIAIEKQSRRLVMDCIYLDEELRHYETLFMRLSFPSPLTGLIAPGMGSETQASEQEEVLNALALQIAKMYEALIQSIALLNATANVKRKGRADYSFPFIRDVFVMVCYADIKKSSSLFWDPNDAGFATLGKFGWALRSFSQSHRGDSVGQPTHWSASLPRCELEGLLPLVQPFIQGLETLRHHLQLMSQSPERIDPHLAQNAALVDALAQFEARWDEAKTYLENDQLAHSLARFVTFVSHVVDLDSQQFRTGTAKAGTPGLPTVSSRSARASEKGSPSSHSDTPQLAVGGKTSAASYCGSPGSPSSPAPTPPSWTRSHPTAASSCSPLRFRSPTPTIFPLLHQTGKTLAHLNSAASNDSAVDVNSDTEESFQERIASFDVGAFLALPRLAALFCIAHHHASVSTFTSTPPHHPAFLDLLLPSTPETTSRQDSLPEAECPLAPNNSARLSKHLACDFPPHSVFSGIPSTPPQHAYQKLLRLDYFLALPSQIPPPHNSFEKVFISGARLAAYCAQSASVTEMSHTSTYAKGGVPRGHAAPKWRGKTATDNVAESRKGELPSSDDIDAGAANLHRPYYLPSTTSKTSNNTTTGIVSNPLLSPPNKKTWWDVHLEEQLVLHIVERCVRSQSSCTSRQLKNQQRASIYRTQLPFLPGLAPRVDQFVGALEECSIALQRTRPGEWNSFLQVTVRCLLAYRASCAREPPHTLRFPKSDSRFTTTSTSEGAWTTGEPTPRGELDNYTFCLDEEQTRHHPPRGYRMTDTPPVVRADLGSFGTSGTKQHNAAQAQVPPPFRHPGTTASSNSLASHSTVRQTVTPGCVDDRGTAPIYNIRNRERQDMSPQRQRHHGQPKINWLLEGSPAPSALPPLSSSSAGSCNTHGVHS